MKSITTTLLATLCFAAAYVQAGAKFNAPTGSTTWNAAEPQFVKWRESGTDANRTTLAMMGNVQVTLWAGSSSNGKTQVADLGSAAATARELQVTFPTTAGGNGQVYFIHLQSLTMPDKVYESHKFGLVNMTGEFGVNVTNSIHTGSSSTNGTKLTGGTSYNTTFGSSDSSSTTTTTKSGAASRGAILASGSLAMVLAGAAVLAL